MVQTIAVVALCATQAVVARTHPREVWGMRWVRRRLLNRTGNHCAFAAVCFLMFLSFASSALAEKRVALVVGNSAYQNVTRLDNPGNDATLMAETLADLGFTLIGGRAQLDLDKAALDTDVQNFGLQIQGADVALFYYAGHGVEIGRHDVKRYQAVASLA